MFSTLRVACLLPLGLALAGPVATPSTAATDERPVAANEKFGTGPFTDQCTSWHLDTAGGSASLRTVCPVPGGHVTSELSMDSTLIGTDVAITPSWPSGTAKEDFSSVCRNCRFDPSGIERIPTTKMVCECDGARPGLNPLSIELYWWVTTDGNGVPCFTDGVVCAQAHTFVPNAEAVDAAEATDASDSA